ncbi:(2Fe-2S)-binding protein [Silvibacterium dinghuense]|uniref:(2Fe-2S)-binding protein n=1 Tax=Silvibacterium dinghuense TaxID=1560006 RepID=A0A4Q1SJ57_9BACT|nr:(2Fe-2S)-binding protein [Silvibacterium dinghuense]RXS97290.1 (2Fe-2S)-binding protein [Silvibacterium dinghuense]GGG97822.1 (2Fe-2S)-binding protein [Silvibacterium dinghuense]
MPETVRLTINGEAVEVPSGTRVAAAMLLAGAVCRTSVSGEPRTALCGMGICMECRAVVNGVPQTKTCQLACQPGMSVETQQGETWR